MNGVRLPPQDLAGNVTPTADANQIYVQVERLPLSTRFVALQEGWYFLLLGELLVTVHCG